MSAILDQEFEDIPRQTSKAPKLIQQNEKRQAGTRICKEIQINSN